MVDNANSPISSISNNSYDANISNKCRCCGLIDVGSIKSIHVKELITLVANENIDHEIQ